MNSNYKAPHPEPSGEASKKREDVLNRIAATIGLANALSGGKAHLTVDDLAVLDAGDGEAVAWQYRWKCDPTGFVYSTLVHPLEGNAPTPDEIEWWVYGVKPTAPPAREGVPEGWREALQKVADDWGVEIGSAEGFFFDAIAKWRPDDSHLLIPRDELILRDDYGVPGSDFYTCKLCGAESGAGLLDNGIPHKSTCRLAAAPTAGEGAKQQ